LNPSGDVGHANDARKSGLLSAVHNLEIQTNTAVLKMMPTVTQNKAYLGLGNCGGKALLLVIPQPH